MGTDVLFLLDAFLFSLLQPFSRRWRNLQTKNFGEKKKIENEQQTTAWWITWKEVQKKKMSAEINGAEAADRLAAWGATKSDERSEAAATQASSAATCAVNSSRWRLHLLSPDLVAPLGRRQSQTRWSRSRAVLFWYFCANYFLARRRNCVLMFRAFDRSQACCRRC